MGGYVSNIGAGSPVIKPATPASSTGGAGSSSDTKPKAASAAAPAVGSTSAAVSPQADAAMMEQILPIVLVALMAVLAQASQQGGASPFKLGSAPANTGASPVPAAATPTVQQPTQNPGGQPVIVQLDDFTGNAGSVNQEILQSGGAQVQAINVNKDQTQPRARSVAEGLEQLVNAARSGQRIDVVNLQQQDFQPSADTQRAQAAIEQLSAMGIPVVVSAGLASNPNTQGLKNQFNTGSTFNVQAIDNFGNLTPLAGNVRQSGTHAPARVSAQIASLKAQGMSLDEIRRTLGIA